MKAGKLDGPAVSVGMPVYNGADYVGEAIEFDFLAYSERDVSELYLENRDAEWVEVEPGIKYLDMREGEGAQPAHQTLVYAMWNMYDSEGREVQYLEKHSSDRFIFQTADLGMLDGGQALESMEKGMESMREGGKRLISISAEKAFGSDGWHDNHFVVEPETDIVLEVSLLWVRQPDPKRMSRGEPSPRGPRVRMEGPEVPPGYQLQVKEEESASPD